MDIIKNSNMLDIITDIIPWDIPEWLSFIILGFLLVLAIYTIIRIGDMIFKVVLTIALIIFIYLFLSGNLSFPLFSQGFEGVQAIKATIIQLL